MAISLHNDEHTLLEILGSLTSAGQRCCSITRRADDHDWPGALSSDDHSLGYTVWPERAGVAVAKVFAKSFGCGRKLCNICINISDG